MLQRYVSAGWWDPALDHGSPQYTYKTSTDTWGPYTKTSSIVNGISSALTRSSSGMSNKSNNLVLKQSHYKNGGKSGRMGDLGLAVTVSNCLF